MSRTITDEHIGVPFRIWTWVGSRNHVLGRGRMPQGMKYVFFGRGGYDAAFHHNSLTTCLHFTLIHVP